MIENIKLRVSSNHRNNMVKSKYQSSSSKRAPKTITSSILIIWRNIRESWSTIPVHKDIKTTKENNKNNKKKSTKYKNKKKSTKYNSKNNNAQNYNKY